MADGVLVFDCGSAATGPVLTDTVNAASVIAAAQAANAAADKAALAAYVATTAPGIVADASSLSVDDKTAAAAANDGSGD